MVDCYVEICKSAVRVGLGVAGVPGLFGGERGGRVDVDAGGQFGIENCGSHAGKPRCYASDTSSLTVCDLVIDLYILPQSAR